MFTFDVTRHVPRFILQDKNGYAVAKAIEAAVQIMNDTIQQGVDCVLNYDTMPEWRLDELAWETNCLYDYNADLETKRRWIKNAIPLYRLFGTPQAVYQYIGSYFGAVDLEERGSLALAHLSHQLGLVLTGRRGDHGDGHAGLLGVDLGQGLPLLILLGLEVQVVNLALGGGSGFAGGGGIPGGVSGCGSAVARRAAAGQQGSRHRTGETQREHFFEFHGIFLLE